MERRRGRPEWGRGCEGRRASAARAVVQPRLGLIGNPRAASAQGNDGPFRKYKNTVSSSFQVFRARHSGVLQRHRRHGRQRYAELMRPTQQEARAHALNSAEYLHVCCPMHSLYKAINIQYTKTTQNPPVGPARAADKSARPPPLRSARVLTFAAAVATCHHAPPCCPTTIGDGCTASKKSTLRVCVVVVGFAGRAVLHKSLIYSKYCTSQ